jgi:uncharacterized membrane protein
MNSQTFGDAQIVGNAYQWSEQNGASALPPLSVGGYSQAVDLSYDGAVVIGQSFEEVSLHSYVSRAVRWQNGLPTSLDSIDGFDGSVARDVSADGSLVVGEVYNRVAQPTFGQADFDLQTRTFLEKGDSRAVLWDTNGDIVDLKTYLTNRFGLGNELIDWQLVTANLISEDGTVIAGQGINPAGDQAIWIVTLSVPEPNSAVALISVILLPLLMRRSAQQRRLILRRLAPAIESPRP